MLVKKGLRMVIVDKGQHYEVMHRVANLQRSDNIEALGQELSFDYLYNRNDRYSRDLLPELGDRVQLADERQIIFEGVITDYIDAFGGSISYTAFDYGFLLNKNEIEMQITDMSADQAVEAICKKYGVKCKVAKMDVPISKNYYGEKMGDAIKEIIGIATYSSGKKYRLEVRGEVLHVEDYKDLIVDPEYKPADNIDWVYATDYPGLPTVTGSIEGMYNHVKVVSDGEEKQQTISEAKDDESIERFGKIEKVQNTNNAEIASNILKDVNKPKITMSITLLGDNAVRSGRIVRFRPEPIMIAGKLVQFGQSELKGEHIVTNCVHSYAPHGHTMALDLVDAKEKDAAVKAVSPDADKATANGEGTPNKDMEAINAMLGKKNGVFKDKGPLIVALAEKYGIPPTLAVAVICSETGYGTAVYHNNPAGIMDPASNWMRVKRYASLDEGLDDAIKNMARIWKEGGQTIAGMGAIYCPVGAANDPGGLNKNWVPSVTSMVDQMGGLYTKPAMVGGGGSEGIGKSGDGIGTGNYIWPIPSWDGLINTYFKHTNQARDFPAPAGSAIVASDGGVVNWVQAWDGVTRSGYSNQTYGNCVRIAHGGGRVTLYAHMIRTVVSNGQKVSKGQIIGYVGSTGASTGPHLHMEIIHNGAGIDPCTIFGHWGTGSYY